RLGGDGRFRGRRRLPRAPCQENHRAQEESQEQDGKPPRAGSRTQHLDSSHRSLPFSQSFLFHHSSLHQSRTEARRMPPRGGLSALGPSRRAAGGICPEGIDRMLSSIVESQQYNRESTCWGLPRRLKEKANACLGEKFTVDLRVAESLRHRLDLRLAGNLA